MNVGFYEFNNLIFYILHATDTHKEVYHQPIALVFEYKTLLRVSTIDLTTDPP